MFLSILSSVSVIFPKLKFARSSGLHSMAYISLRQNGLLMSIRPISSPFTHVHIFNTKYEFLTSLFTSHTMETIMTLLSFF